MPQKEVGAIYVARCPICGDELSVGWDRGEVAMIADVAKVKKATKNVATGVAAGPLTCSCANLVTIHYEVAKGRASVSWVTDEPSVGNVNLH